MKLWLLRHGEAEQQGGDDSARKLTERGCRQIAEMAEKLRPYSFSKVYVSPYVRAQQSARLLGVVASVRLLTVPWLVPETDPKEVLRQLDEDENACVLLVAHQPLLGKLAGLLVHGNRQQSLALGTANLVELEGFAVAGVMELLRQYQPSC